ncbi:MAG: transglycosylase SLT domain-containing protein [Bacteroidales bacterium]|nr:transglycosylase SLT domain-containing protein [Bacteroidales bacterium]
MKKLSIIAIILSSMALIGQIFIFASQKESEDDVYKKALANDYRIYAPVLPDTLDFCGEPVPMDIYYVRESLDRELMANMYWQSNTLLIMKRAGRFFPVIEPILKRNGVPEDFKYLCVIESGLLNVTSPANASGYWQFLKSTGAKYGLEINDDIDMRNDMVAATEAACRYLKASYARFGNWTDAAASYNCGESGLATRLNKQGVSSYYQVRLNSETTRYVYRILAMKLIMQHPQQYGFFVRRCDLYPPLPTRTVQMSGQNIDLYQFAHQHGTTYKVLRELNPWLVNDKVVNKANKTYTVHLPIENGIKMSTIRKKKDNTLVTRL